MVFNSCKLLSKTLRLKCGWSAVEAANFNRTVDFNRVRLKCGWNCFSFRYFLEIFYQASFVSNGFFQQDFKLCCKSFCEIAVEVRLKRLLSTARLISTASGWNAVEKFPAVFQPLQPHFNRDRKFLTLLVQLSIFLVDLFVGTYRLSSHARLEAFVIQTKLN